MMTNWSFEEELFSIEREAKELTGGTLELFHSLVRLYEEKYYPLPRDNGEVCLPERASRHISLALARLGGQEAAGEDAMVAALKKSELMVYGPGEIEEVRKVVSSHAAGDANAETTDGTGKSNGSEAPKKTADANIRADESESATAKVSKRTPRAPVAPPPNQAGPSNVEPQNSTTRLAKGNGGSSSRHVENSHEPPQKGSDAIIAGQSDASQEADERERRKPAPVVPPKKARSATRSSVPAKGKTQPSAMPGADKGIEARLRAIESWMASMNRRPTHQTSGGMAPNAEMRLANLEREVKNIGAMRAGIEGLRKEISSLRARLEQLERAKATASNPVHVANETEARAHKELQALKRGLEAIEAEQLELKQAIAEVAPWMETFKSIVAALSAQVEELQKNVAGAESTPAPPRKLIDLVMRKKR